jgi:hypothetical protein
MTTNKSKKAEDGQFKSKFEVQNLFLILQGRPGSLLVVHNFSEKAKQEIRDKHAKKARQKKEERSPGEEYQAAKYLDAAGRECIPVTALKKSFISAATAFDDITKVGLRQALFVSGINGAGPLIPIETLEGKPAVGLMREDAVTIGLNTRNLTYRPEYSDWQIRIRVEFNPRIISKEQLLALVDQAGWGVGICEGRPEKTSALGWGRFQRAE